VDSVWFIFGVGVVLCLGVVGASIGVAIGLAKGARRYAWIRHVQLAVIVFLLVLPWTLLEGWGHSGLLLIPWLLGEYWGVLLLGKRIWDVRAQRRWPHAVDSVELVVLALLVVGVPVAVVISMASATPGARR
jgi:hypothetical protein